MWCQREGGYNPLRAACIEANKDKCGACAAERTRASVGVRGSRNQPKVPRAFGLMTLTIAPWTRQIANILKGQQGQDK